VEVTMPSVNCILGDKLTAFAYAVQAIELLEEECDNG